MSPRILSIFAAILSAILYLLVITPVYTGSGTFWSPGSSIAALKSSNKQYAVTLEQIDTIEQGAAALYKDYTSLTPEMQEKMNILLSPAVDPVKLRNEVVNIVSRSGIAIEDLEVTKDTVGYKGLDFYVVSFKVKSRYPAFKKLVTDFDKNMRFYNLQSVILERQPEKEGDDNLKASLTDKDLLDIQVKFRVYQMK